jgi:hypothetical protein
VSQLADSVTALQTPEQLYDLLDPEVMWYSADVNSNLTCNDKDDAVACIERNVAYGMTGHFEVLAEGEDVVVVRPMLDPPREGQGCLLLRFRDGLIVEMRDFASATDALVYAGAVA